MVGLGIVPAVIQCVLLFFMPETPRWLVKAKRSDEARVIIEKTSGSDRAAVQMVDSILKDIEIEVRGEETSASLGNSDGKHRGSWLLGWRELVFVPKNRRALTIACLLQGLQQLCGFVGILCIRECATVFNANSLLIFLPELAYVLLGDDIPYAWLHRAHVDVAKRCLYEFHLYSRCTATH